jgi:regulation of enolase protein 1 (concanavalin A-like superfamily)
MNKTLHIIRKDLRFNRWALLLWLTAVITHFAFRCMQIKDPSWGGSALARSSRIDHLVLFALPLLIIPFLMQPDALFRRYAFWRSLPMNGARLLLAKGIAVVCGFIVLPMAFEVTYLYLAGLESVLWNSLSIWIFLHVPLVVVAFLICVLTPGWKSYFCIMLPVMAALAFSTMRTITLYPKRIENKSEPSLATNLVIAPPENSQFQVTKNSEKINLVYSKTPIPNIPGKFTISTLISPSFEFSMENLPLDTVITKLDSTIKTDLNGDDKADSALENEPYLIELKQQVRNLHRDSSLPLSESYVKKSITGEKLDSHSFYGKAAMFGGLPYDLNESSRKDVTLEGEITVHLSKKIVIHEMPLRPNTYWKHGLHQLAVETVGMEPGRMAFDVKTSLQSITSDFDILRGKSPYLPYQQIFVFVEHNRRQLGVCVSRLKRSDWIYDYFGMADISRHRKTYPTLSDDSFTQDESEQGKLAMLRFEEEDKGLENWAVKIVAYEPMGIVKIPVSLKITKPRVDPMYEQKPDELQPILPPVEQRLAQLKWDDPAETLLELESIFKNTNSQAMAKAERLVYPILIRLFEEKPQLVIERLYQHAESVEKSYDPYQGYHEENWVGYEKPLSPFWDRVVRFIATAATQEHKELILENLHPLINFLELLDRMDWYKEAMPRLIQMHMEQPVPLHWSYIFSRYPASDSDKNRAFIRQMQLRAKSLSRIVHVLDQMTPEADRKSAAAELWEVTVQKADSPRQMQVAFLLALKYGVEVAPRDFYRLMMVTDDVTYLDPSSQYAPLIGMFQALANYSDCPPDFIKGREWLLMNGKDLKWNETSRRFEIPPFSQNLSSDPVPSNWGTRIDPLGVGKVESLGGGEVIKLSTMGYTTDYPVGFLDRNAPRLMQEVSGNFTAEVTIQPIYNASPTWDRDNSKIQQSAAILVEAGNTNHFRMETLLQGADLKKHIRECMVKTLAEWNYYREAAAFDPNKPVMLRISRHGDEFTAAWKQAGIDWQVSPTHLCSHWPKSVKVGLFVSNRCVKSFSAVFSGYEIKTGEEAMTKAVILPEPLAKNSLPHGAMIPQWGTLHNVWHSAAVYQQKNELRMMLLPRMNDYKFSNLLKAPVTINRVKGDFVQEVTVAPIHEANWFGEYLYFRNGNAHMFRFGPGWGKSPMMDIHASGLDYPFYTPPHNFQVDFKQPMRLRLRRVGKLFYAAVKQGEKYWQEMAPFYLNCAEELEVGVVALNTSDKKLEAVFTDYTLTQP